MTDKEYARKHYGAMAWEASQERHAEMVQAMKEQPCNGDRCRWVGSFDDGWGQG